MFAHVFLILSTSLYSFCAQKKTSHNEYFLLCRANSTNKLIFADKWRLLLTGAPDYQWAFGANLYFYKFLEQRQPEEAYRQKAFSIKYRKLYFYQYLLLIHALLETPFLLYPLRSYQYPLYLVPIWKFFF